MQLNSSKPIGGLLAMAFFIYIVYILMTSEPLERMNRICTPVTLWPARIVVSGARIFAPSHAESLQQHFNNGFYTCRKWVWGALYSDEYEKARAQQSGAQEGAPSAPARSATTGSRADAVTAQ
jgi:hypothetical protein